MVEKRKIVITHAIDGSVDGWLMELKKDAYKTAVYMTCALPGAFKGYHAHKEQTSNYVVLRGRVQIEMYKKPGLYETVTLEQGDAHSIGINVGIGLRNIGDEELWMINFPAPYYDPMNKDEQENYDAAGIKKWYMASDEVIKLHVLARYPDITNKISKRFGLNFSIDAHGIMQMDDYSRRIATPEEIILWGALIGSNNIDLIRRASKGEEIDFMATAEEIFKVCIWPLVYLSIEEYEVYANSGGGISSSVRPSVRIPIGYYLYPVGQDEIDWNNMTIDNCKLRPI